MSTLLFDVPGPRARRRHQIYTAISLLVLLAIGAEITRRLVAEEVLSPEVVNDVFQNRNVKFLAEGLVNNFKAAGLAIVGSLVLGALLAVARLSDRLIFRWPAVAFIQFFRAIPLVLLMVFLLFSFFIDIALLAVVVALILYNGSVLAEVFRAGINAVQQGQSEAAYAIGLRKSQVMGIILMPQAVRFMLPAIISQCVIVFKDTSLGAIVVYDEIVRDGRIVAQSVPNGTILTYVTIAVVFMVINYSLSRLAQYLERRLSQSGAGDPDEVSQVTSSTSG